MSDQIATQSPVSPGPDTSADSPYRAFNRSVVISGIRCTLTYVVLPYLAPLIGLSGGIGPVLGLIVGAVAIAANVFTIRRFWASDHKWRVPATVISVGVIILLLILAVEDIRDLLGS